VVVLRAQDGIPMRAKVTLRLEEPQTQETADELTDQCADLVRAVVREAPSASVIQGLEAAIAIEVLTRMPKGPVAIRGVEIAGLHIVGDPGHAARTPSSPEEGPAWLQAALSPPAASSDTRPSGTPSPASSERHPPAPSSGMPARRRPTDPFASTAVSPSPFAQPARQVDDGAPGRDERALRPKPHGA
jgi:hypothetical protein